MGVMVLNKREGETANPIIFLVMYNTSAIGLYSVNLCCVRCQKSILQIERKGDNCKGRRKQGKERGREDGSMEQ